MCRKGEHTETSEELLSAYRLRLGHGTLEWARDARARYGASLNLPPAKTSTYSTSLRAYIRLRIGWFWEFMAHLGSPISDFESRQACVRGWRMIPQLGAQWWQPKEVVDARGVLRPVPINDTITHYRFIAVATAKVEKIDHSHYYQRDVALPCFACVLTRMTLGPSPQK